MSSFLLRQSVTFAVVVIVSGLFIAPAAFAEQAAQSAPQQDAPKAAPPAGESGEDESRAAPENADEEAPGAPDEGDAPPPVAPSSTDTSSSDDLPGEARDETEEATPSTEQPRGTAPGDDVEPEAPAEDPSEDEGLARPGATAPTPNEGPPKAGLRKKENPAVLVPTQAPSRDSASANATANESEEEEGGVLDSSLSYTSVGLAVGLAAPVALAGLTAVLVVGSILTNPLDQPPQSPIGLFSVVFQILRFPAFIAGPLGVCGASAGALTFAFVEEEASFWPAVVGAGVGIVTLGASLAATIYGFFTFNSGIEGDPLLLTGLVTVPLTLYALSGVVTLASVVATDYLLPPAKPKATTDELAPPPQTAGLAPVRY